MSIVSFFLALAYGAASFVSPCVLPLLPAYLSFVSGLSVDEVQKGSRRVVWGTLAFFAGLALVFTLLGYGLSVAGLLVANQDMLRIVGGAILIVLGLVLAIFTLPGFLQRDMRPFLAKAPRGPAGAFLVGMAFALGWSPCIGPLLAATLTMASQSDNAGLGALLLFVFSLGLGIPFLISGLFVSWALRAFARIRKHMRVIQIVCGVILVVYGALLIAGVPLSFE